MLYAVAILGALATAGAAPHRIPLKKIVTARHELKYGDLPPITDPADMVETRTSASRSLTPAPVVIKNF